MVFVLFLFFFLVSVIPYEIRTFRSTLTGMVMQYCLRLNLFFALEGGCMPKMPFADKKL